MQRHSVTSSNIQSIGYDEASETLEVEFKGGGIYQYQDVPPHIHLDLMSADSKGKYLYQNIRMSYRFRRIS